MTTKPSFLYFPDLYQYIKNTLRWTEDPGLM